MATEKLGAIIDSMHTAGVNNYWEEFDQIASGLTVEPDFERKNMVEYLLNQDPQKQRPMINDIHATCLAWLITAVLDDPIICNKVLEKYRSCASVWERDQATPISKLWWAVTMGQISNHKDQDNTIKEKAMMLNEKLVEAAVAEMLNYDLQKDIKGWIDTSTRIAKQYPYTRDHFGFDTIKDRMIFLLDFAHEAGLHNLGLRRRPPFNTNRIAIERYQATLAS